VVHGDLKPENVLMSARGAVTLSDFGCSKARARARPAPRPLFRLHAFGRLRLSS